MERPDFAALDAGMRGFGHLERWLAHAKAWMPRLSMRPEQAVKQWEAEYGASPALDKLCGAAVFYASFPALFETLLWGEEADFLRASGKGWESGAVRLMTLHAAKGMEFPAVFVSGVKAGVLPLERKGRAVDLCEERRLFYVGMTRAKRELDIVTFRKPGLESAFSGEVFPPKAKEPPKAEKRKLPQVKRLTKEQIFRLSETYEPGTRLRHKAFGLGTLVSRSGDIVIIAFDSGEVKKLALSTAIRARQLRHSD